MVKKLFVNYLLDEPALAKLFYNLFKFKQKLKCFIILKILIIIENLIKIVSKIFEKVDLIVYLYIVQIKIK